MSLFILVYFSPSAQKKGFSTSKQIPTSYILTHLVNAEHYPTEAFSQTP